MGNLTTVLEGPCVYVYVLVVEQEVDAEVARRHPARQPASQAASAQAHSTAPPLHSRTPTPHLLLPGRSTVPPGPPAENYLTADTQPVRATAAAAESTLCEHAQRYLQTPEHRP